MNNMKLLINITINTTLPYQQQTCHVKHDLIVSSTYAYIYGLVWWSNHIKKLTSEGIERFEEYAVSNSTLSFSSSVRGDRLSSLASQRLSLSLTSFGKDAMLSMECFVLHVITTMQEALKYRGRVNIYFLYKSTVNYHHC